MEIIGERSMLEARQLLIENLTEETIQTLQNCEKTFTAFLKHNKGFIEKIARKYVHYTDDRYDDMFQIGCIALVKSLKKFDPSRNNASTFSTFAWVVIDNDLKREMFEYNTIDAREESIEEPHHRRIFNDTSPNDPTYEYREDRWRPIYGKKVSMETEIVNKITIEEIMRGFTPDQQRIIRGRTCAMTYKEIVSNLPGMSENKAKLIFHYASKKKNFMKYGEVVLSEA